MKFKEFFYFSKSDRAALLVLLAVGILAFLLIYGIGRLNDKTDPVSTDSQNLRKMPVSSRKPTRSREAQYYYAAPERKEERFSFDPNTADSTQLLRLGLQPWQVRAIYHYRAKGGIFRKKTDFARLYGLTVKQYRELEPYIKISSDYLPAAEVYAEKNKKVPFHRDSIRFHEKFGPTERILLNRADTSQLKKVPGIGSYFARQVVNYRNRLGGFYSLDQLAEIDDFPMESVKYMILDAESIRKINLNKLTLNQLKRHPYINFYQAREICDYRRLKGPLRSLDDLRLLKDFPREAIERLRPYAEF
ncbi:helix-hairpin-helix domain-containing protein [Prevotella sp. KH2C16]|uniref:helix-hairpin-helix domain-containing protein n=1 Tax=Prevotella sp. KH2C16 TaxID=1855325 RepID=UPI0008E51474|nr:helix-hairpin-helix domain-containing protein [Prevotella sp. KH2C16]SFG05296.1 DNA uptake protein ComE [Prevotella sp. KH2C16]